MIIRIYLSWQDEHIYFGGCHVGGSYSVFIENKSQAPAEQPVIIWK